MHRLAFKMKLHPNQESEYKRRHDTLWPELKKLLSDSGVSDYSIFLDEETHELLGILKVENIELFDRLGEQPIMKKWWTHMHDIMDSHEDHSPLTQPLKEIFYLP